MYFEKTHWLYITYGSLAKHDMKKVHLPEVTVFLNCIDHIFKIFLSLPSSHFPNEQAHWPKILMEINFKDMKQAHWPKIVSLPSSYFPNKQAHWPDMI